MSINGVRGPFDGFKPPTGLPARVNDRAATPSPAAPATTRGAQGVAAPQVPAQPPPGTDPELWQVLTNDERAYFARLGAMGPLTYGRVLSGHAPPTPPAARGVRLDVKA
jgi:hypothetical protein